MFGIQLMNYGQIKDWNCANYLWDKLQSKIWTWQELDQEFRLQKNKLMTEFRKLTIKY